MSEWDPVPGRFDHRGLDCEKHGENVSPARPRGRGTFLCVACMLETLERLEAEERNEQRT